jgi:hypothetical protein
MVPKVPILPMIGGCLSLNRLFIFYFACFRAGLLVPIVPNLPKEIIEHVHTRLAFAAGEAEAMLLGFGRRIINLKNDGVEFAVFELP